LGWSGITLQEVLICALILWAIVTVGLIIIFTIGMIIFAAILGGEVGAIVSTRPLYVLIRLFDLAIFPFALLSGLHINTFGHSGASGIAAIIVIIILTLYVVGILLIFFIIHTKHTEKSLYKPFTKGRFLPIYGFLKIKYIHFVFLPSLKRLLVGFLLGILYGIPTAQIIVAAAICILYPILILLSESYADPLQAWAEVIMSVLTGIAYLILFGFSGTILPLEQRPATSSETNIALTAGYLSIHYLAIGVALSLYAANSLQKFGVFSFSQFGACLCGGKSTIVERSQTNQLPPPTNSNLPSNTSNLPSNTSNLPSTTNLLS